MRYNSDEVEVWKMGKKRKDTLFYRKERRALDEIQ
jgi:hypothetical protein